MHRPAKWRCHMKVLRCCMLAGHDWCVFTPCHVKHHFFSVPLHEHIAFALSHANKMHCWPKGCVHANLTAHPSHLLTHWATWGSMNHICSNVEWNDHHDWGSTVSPQDPLKIWHAFWISAVLVIFQQFSIFCCGQMSSVKSMAQLWMTGPCLFSAAGLTGTLEPSDGFYKSDFFHFVCTFFSCFVHFFFKQTPKNLFCFQGNYSRDFRKGPMSIQIWIRKKFPGHKATLLRNLNDWWEGVFKQNEFQSLNEAELKHEPGSCWFNTGTHSLSDLKSFWCFPTSLELQFGQVTAAQNPKTFSVWRWLVSSNDLFVELGA